MTEFAWKGSNVALLVAMLAFVGGHFALSSQPVRSRLVGRLGERTFAALYSVLMVFALIWVIAAYRVAPPRLVWDLGPWANLIPLLAMPFALILAVLGLTVRSPTAMGGAKAFDRDVPPVQGVFTITRHPFLSAAAIWSLAHLIANGDLASILLFGGFAVLSIGGMAAIDHKLSLKLGPRWQAYADRTSRMPFAAALTKGMAIDWRGIGWVRPLLGVALYVVLVYAHDWLFGVPAGLIVS
jgi:uncharacterized membrane protein